MKIVCLLLIAAVLVGCETRQTPRSTYKGSAWHDVSISDRYPGYKLVCERDGLIVGYIYSYDFDLLTWYTTYDGLPWDFDAHRPSTGFYRTYGSESAAARAVEIAADRDGICG